MRDWFGIGTSTCGASCPGFVGAISDFQLALGTVFSSTDVANLYAGNGCPSEQLLDGSFELCSASPPSTAFFYNGCYAVAPAMGGKNSYCPWGWYGNGRSNLIQSNCAPWGGDQAKDGSWYAGIQGTSAIQQTVNNLVIGATYKLSFWISGRPGDGVVNPLVVHVGVNAVPDTYGPTGGTSIYSNNGVGSGTWSFQETSSWVPTTSSMNIVFQGLSTTSGNNGAPTQFVDLITLVRVLPPPPPPPSPTPPSPSPPLPPSLSAPSGIISQYRAAAFAAGQWNDNNINNGQAGYGSTLVNVAISVDTAGTYGATCDVSYVSGTAASSIIFAPNMPALPMSICTVSRYTGPNSSRNRIFQSTNPNANWIHGHHAASAGIAMYGAWVTTNANVVNPNNNWVIQCSSLPAGGVNAVTMVNGALQTTGTITSGFTAPGRIGINTDSTYASAFGAAELILWNRSLTSSELYTASKYLSTKYCIDITVRSSPPPMPPSPPAFSAPAYLLSAANSAVAQYDATTFDSTVGLVGAWTDSINSYGSTLLGASLAVDTAGTYGASCDVSYVSGTVSSSIVFAPNIAALPMSICTVSRYTGPNSSRNRIFQSTTANWFSGHNAANAGVAFFEAWATLNANAVSPNNTWVIQCSSLPAAGVNAISMVNGALQTSPATSGFVAPGRVGINMNSGAGASSTSAFGAAELILWNRSLTSSELYTASKYLGTKYCLSVANAPPSLSSPPPPSPSPPPPPPSSSSPSALWSNSSSTLSSGSHLTSSNGAYTATMDPEGSFCVRSSPSLPGTPVLCLTDSGRYIETIPGAVANMQTDANFCIRSGTSTVWCTSANGAPYQAPVGPYAAAIQPDGNFCIRDWGSGGAALWCSGVAWLLGH